MLALLFLLPYPCAGEGGSISGLAIDPQGNPILVKPIPQPAPMTAPIGAES